MKKLLYNRTLADMSNIQDVSANSEEEIEEYRKNMLNHGMNFWLISINEEINYSQ